MNSILVTTDLSEESKQAFPQALRLAKAFKAKIILLAVIEDPAQAAFAYALDFPVYPDPDIYKQVKEKVNNDLKTLAQGSFSDVPHEYIVMEATGPVHTEVLNFANKHQVDLIVISTHGRTGLSRLLIGSVAEKLIREARSPVLVVPVGK